MARLLQAGCFPVKVLKGNIICFPSVFWHCWLGDRKVSKYQSVKVLKGNIIHFPSVLWHYLRLRVKTSCACCCVSPTMTYVCICWCRIAGWMASTRFITLSEPSFSSSSVCKQSWSWTAWQQVTEFSALSLSACCRTVPPASYVFPQHDIATSQYSHYLPDS